MHPITTTQKACSVLFQHFLRKREKFIFLFPLSASFYAPVSNHIIGLVGRVVFKLIVLLDGEKV